jgi:mannose/fructose/N-acetylgalactosamine-specific phosphotransferase system component IIB
MSDYKIIDGKDVDPENGMILDYGQDEEINPENLPDADEILDNVILILEYMGTEEIMKLRSENNEVFISTMENKFESFAERYYSVFRMVISGKDISPLFEMLRVIKQMKTGNMSVERGEQQIGNRLKQFLPDGFEEKLKNMPQNKKGKKKKHPKK